MNLVAGKLADYLGHAVDDGRRGVLGLNSIGHLVAFGRDDHEEGRPRRAVELLRRGLACLRLPVLGHGGSIDDGRTWAMIIDADPADRAAAERVGELLRALSAGAGVEDEACDAEDLQLQGRLAFAATEEIERFRRIFQ
jgi:hypothetical protein